MPGYYQTPEWRALRKQCLDRDRWRCVLCGDKAVVADHITARRQGGADTLSNLRALCRLHDNQLRERNGARPDLTTIGPDGWPQPF